VIDDELSSKQALAIFLGASWYPKAPKLASGVSFYRSAADFRDYLTDSNGLGLPKENVAWLFDDSRSPGDQLEDISSFLQSRSLELRSQELEPTDLIIYYVGHGLFTKQDQAYCLAVRATNQSSEGLSSIRASDLATVIKDNARFLRRFLILDSCFSATIYREFQSGPLAAARIQLLAELPQRGTALLCSSNAQSPSLAPEKLAHTMFSGSLLKALRQGDPALGPRMSFSDLGYLLRQNLEEEFPNSWVRPEVLSPDQREGDIASIPLFPNPRYHALLVEQRKLERQSAEAARLAQETAEAERRRIEAARLAQETAEAERRRSEAARLAQETAEAERRRTEAAQLARAKAETERRSAEAERLARQTADENRVHGAGLLQRLRLSTQTWMLILGISVSLAVALIAWIGFQSRDATISTPPANIPQSSEKSPLPSPPQSAMAHLKVPNIDLAHSNTFSDGIDDTAFSDDGKQFALAWRKDNGKASTVDIFDSATGKKIDGVNGRKDDPLGVISFSHDKRFVVSPGYYGYLWLLDVANHNCTKISEESISDAKFSADDRTILYITDAHELKEIDIHTHRIMRTVNLAATTLKNPSRGRFYANGAIAGLADAEGVVILKLDTSELTRVPMEDLPNASAKLFLWDISPDAKSLLLETWDENYDGTIFVWDIPTGRHVHSEKVFSGDLHYFTPNAQFVASADYGNGIAWHSAATLQALGRSPVTSDCGAVYRLRFASNGLALSTGSPDTGKYSACIWRIPEYLTATP